MRKEERRSRERETDNEDAKQGTFFGQSALARHCLAVETSVVKVPKGLDLALLAPLGCGLQSGSVHIPISGLLTAVPAVLLRT